MKKYITLATLLAAGSAFANATEITWTGAVGDGLYETGANWSSDTAPTMGDTVLIADGASVVQKTRLDWWNMDVTITDGASLTCEDSVTKWQTGVVTVSNGGTLVIKDKGDDMVLNCGGDLTINCLSQNGITIEDHVKITNSGVGNTTINFGTKGSMSVNEIWNGAWTIKAVLQLENGADIEVATGYELVTREFFDLDHNTGNNIYGLAIKETQVTGSDSGTMSAVESSEALTLDANGMGKYLLSEDPENGSWSVSYIRAIPEPSAFGLLAGLGALALVGTRRRKRA